MESDTWRTILVAALALNAALGLGYRIYRLSQRGPVADVVGQAVLALVLGALAAAISQDVGWPRWAALVYGLLFGVVVMPIWTLAVLIPLEPRRIDYAFTVSYWALLAVIVVTAIAV